MCSEKSNGNGLAGRPTVILYFSFCDKENLFKNCIYQMLCKLLSGVTNRIFSTSYIFFRPCRFLEIVITNMPLMNIDGNQSALCFNRPSGTKTSQRQTRGKDTSAPSVETNSDKLFIIQQKNNQERKIVYLVTVCPPSIVKCFSPQHNI